jgi:hypothetical protein
LGARDRQVSVPGGCGSDPLSGPDDSFTPCDQDATSRRPVVIHAGANHCPVEQRWRYELIGDGSGIHWPDVDEDISVRGMLDGVPARRPSGGRR